MAGRATIRHMHPFCSAELPGKLNLSNILNHGSIPPVFFSEEPKLELADYVGTYVKEEVQSEALVRRIENFSRFLEFAARANGEILNFESTGSDAQVPARTVREYYQVLEDTLVGYRLEPIKSSQSRKSVATGKFFFFDIGVVNSLCGRKEIIDQSEDWGRALEHFVFLELLALKDYQERDLKIQFWNSPREGEVDFILNEEIAIEVKASKNINNQHLKSLRLFSSASKPRKQIVVCQEKAPRKIDQVQILPVHEFLKQLWSGEITA